MAYFLLVYDRSRGKLVREIEDFDATELEAANRRRAEAEAEYLESDWIEIALMGADSRENLTRTHSRYFRTLRELAQLNRAG